MSRTILYRLWIQVSRDLMWKLLGMIKIMRAGEGKGGRQKSLIMLRILDIVNLIKRKKKLILGGK